MYEKEQDLHLYLYATAFVLSSDGLVFGMQNIFAKVRTGLNATRTPAFVRTLFTFSETPLTYGRHDEPRISFSTFRFTCVGSFITFSMNLFL
jgi:hypothetical protein